MSNVTDTRNFMERIAESDRFFQRSGKVHETLREFTRSLTDKAQYAIIGGMALVAHGYLRTTVDIDILVTADGLDRILSNRLCRFAIVQDKRRSLRDVKTGIRIDFFLTGQFPGDGKPKPVAFPDPALVAVSMQDIQVVSLPALIELKLASGMTNPGRLRDLADVQELIRTLRLPDDFAAQLNPYVREKFTELRSAVQADRASSNLPDAGGIKSISIMPDARGIEGLVLMGSNGVK